MAGLGLTTLQGASEAWSFALGAFAVALSYLLAFVIARYRFRVQFFKAQTDRIVRMRELEVAERQMVFTERQAILEAELEPRTSLTHPAQQQIPFPFNRKAERPAISSPNSEAA